MAEKKSTSTKKKQNEELPVITQLLVEKFGDQVLGHHAQHGDETVVIAREGMLEVFKFLRDDKRCAFNMMIDLTAVDYMPRDPRFEVVYHLKSLGLAQRIRIKIPISETAAEVDSIEPLWVAADWYERECGEMYGIDFKGHPNLDFLLLYEGFQGHPLRKDYEKEISQPRLQLRAIKERHNYGEHFQYIEGALKASSEKEVL